MNVPRIFANAIVRRLAYVVVAMALAWMGLGEARAAVYADQGAAWSACQSRLGTIGTGFACFQHLPTGYRTCQASYTSNDACNNPGGVTFTWPAGKGCANRTGDGDGPSSGAFVGDPSTKVCHNGCEYGIAGGSGGTQYNFGGDPIGVWQQGTWQPSGSVCNAQTTPPTPPEEVCQTQGSLTQCVRKDGRHCTKSSSGKSFCWRPDEAGTKNDGNESATKSPIDKPNNPPPTKPPNNGDWEQSGQGNVTIVNNNGASTTYNNTNYTSSNGTNGSGGSSTNPDGSDNPSEGDDDHGSVGGDGSCSGSFTCSGGDPVLCAVAQQQYRARCEAEARFDGEGTFPGDGDAGAGTDPDKGDVYSSHTIGLGALDEAGLGMTGSCPDLGSFEVMGRTIDVDPNGNFCQIIGVARACLILFGAFIALGILAGRDNT